MKTLIENARVVSPGVEEPGAAILIDGASIQGVFRAGEPRAPTDRTVDAEGRRVLPGLIDMHVHGADGYDICDGGVEAIRAIAAAKLREGVTTFLPTTLTLPEERLADALRAVAEYRREPRFAKAPGVHLEGPFINPGNMGALNPDHVRRPDLEEVKRLHAIAPVRVVSFAVELDGALDFARGLRALGIVASCGHSAATHAQMQAAKAAGVMNLTHFCNQMSPLHHREVGLVGSGLLDDDLLVEMICDRIHLCDEMIALVFKVKPIEKIALITDAVQAAGLPDGEYRLGGLPVRVQEGVARLISNGALAGNTQGLSRGLRHVHEITGLPLAELVRTTAWNQAENLGLEGLGRIERGYRADLVMLDDALEPVSTWVDGEERWARE